MTLIIDEPIHEWFELTYAQYLTVPRSILQSMPVDWQRKFVDLLNELDDTFDWRPKEGRYWVELRDSKGRFTKDALRDYDRGRRRIKGDTDGTFQRNHVYSADDIKANSIETDDPTEYSGILYLIARASDGREYWFVEKDGGWIVDHTWVGFQLVHQE